MENESISLIRGLIEQGIEYFCEMFVSRMAIYSAFHCLIERGGYKTETAVIHVTGVEPGGGKVWYIVINERMVIAAFQTVRNSVRFQGRACISSDD